MSLDFGDFALTRVLGRIIDKVFDYLVSAFTRGPAEEVISESPSPQDDFVVREAVELCARQLSLLAAFSDLSNMRDYLSKYQQMARDLRSQNMRVYVLGHQNAGKSTLVNAVAGLKLSQVQMTKCTACLVQIRNCSSKKVKLIWADKTLQEVSYKLFVERMCDWANSPDRPYKAEICTPYPIFGSSRNELVDTPGSGSDDESHGSYSEEALVAEAVEKAAAAILVYRVSHSGYGAHHSLLQKLAQSGASVFVVCNIDAEYREKCESKEDRQEVERCVERNSKDIFRKLTDAAGGKGSFRLSFYRINLKKAASAPAHKETEDSNSFDELKNNISQYLNNRSHLIVQQSIKEQMVALRDMRQQNAVLSKSLEPNCQSLKSDIAKRKAELVLIKEALGKYQRTLSTAGGAVAGGAVGADAGLMIDVLLLGTSLGLFTAIGGVLGSLFGAAAGSSATDEAVEEVKKAWKEFMTLKQGSVPVTSLEGSSELETLIRSIGEKKSVDKEDLEKAFTRMIHAIDAIVHKDEGCQRHARCLAFETEAAKLSEDLQKVRDAMTA